MCVAELLIAGWLSTTELTVCMPKTFTGDVSIFNMSSVGWDVGRVRQKSRPVAKEDTGVFDVAF